MRVAGTLPDRGNGRIGADARLLAVATAVPPYVLGQSDVTRRIELALGPRSREIVRLLPMFGNTGIERRYSCVPIEWYERLHDWPERNQVYLDSAIDLLESATLSVLERAGRRPDEIDAIVVVSTTGIATPSLDALLMERMNLRRTVRRLPIFGLGCAGGTIGLSRAATMAASMPGSLVLFLVVELCALCFRRDDFTKSNIVATALFGDGAAAALLSSRGGGTARRRRGRIHVARFARRHGLGGDARRLQSDLLARYPGARDDQASRSRGRLFRESATCSCGDIDAFLCHPGGAKVLDALEVAYELGAGSPRRIARSAARLRQHVGGDGDVRAGARLRHAVAARTGQRARPRFHRGLHAAREGLSATSVLWIVLILVALQRAVESFYAERNTRRLLASGGVEAGASQYPFFLALARRLARRYGGLHSRVARAELVAARALRPAAAAALMDHRVARVRIGRPASSPSPTRRSSAAAPTASSAIQITSWSARRSRCFRSPSAPSKSRSSSRF